MTLKLIKREDGIWLHVETSNKRCAINLGTRSEQSIVQRCLESAIIEQAQDEEKELNYEG